jgi:tetratricopeptide (TPR) repeat protein
LLGVGGFWFGRVYWIRSYLRDAEHALESQNYAGALEDLRQYLAYRPNDFEAHLLAARTSRRAAMSAPFRPGWDQEAVQHLIDCEILQPKSEAVELERVQLSALRGQSPGSVTRLMVLVKDQHPDTPLILETLVRVNLDDHHLDRAVGFAGRLLELRPDHIQALLWRALAHDLLQAPRLAVPDYRRVVELRPDDDGVRLRLAADLVSSRLFAEAQQHFELLIQRMPDNEAVLLGLAHCWENAGRVEEATRLLDRLLVLAPHHGMALAERGTLAMEANQLAQAEKMLREAVSVRPFDAQANYSLYLCLQKVDKKDEAEQYLERYNHINEDAKRMKDLQKLIGDSPNDPDLRYEAGVLALRYDQDEFGVGWLMSALELDPRHSATHKALADYYEHIGKKDLADQHRR